MLLCPGIVYTCFRFLAGFTRFGDDGAARVGGRRRDVDHEQQRIGAGGVGLWGEGEGAGLDGTGDGFEVLWNAC